MRKLRCFRGSHPEQICNADLFSPPAGGVPKGDLCENYDAQKIGLKYISTVFINIFENHIDREILK